MDGDREGADPHVTKHPDRVDHAARQLNRGEACALSQLSDQVIMPVVELDTKRLGDYAEYRWRINP